jgi:release factor glutamine methyltransferase
MPPVRTLGEWRRAAASMLVEAGVDAARVEADLLARHGLGITREALLREPGLRLDPGARRRLSRLLHKRLRRIPLQYLTGEVDFCGLTFRVNPSVLIPRPETEGLVERALALLPAEEPARVLDVGTGSGCIAAAIASARPRAQVWATDLSPAAARTAVRNMKRLGLASRVLVLEGDLTEPLGNRGGHPGFSVVVSNPPYVGETERDRLSPEVAVHEPETALFAGPDGMAVIRRLIPRAGAHLVPGGWLVLEIGETQGPRVERAFSVSGGWNSVRLERDLAGRVRYALARKS